mmetsp:Transcript_47902/g.133079  ORF Transcript_47902/g.133079 Transcript_47902/m.133079 type:complete len:233 (-) Transcript_47902:1046-1744(-)
MRWATPTVPCDPTGSSSGPPRPSTGDCRAALSGSGPMAPCVCRAPPVPGGAPGRPPRPASSTASWAMGATSGQPAAPRTRTSWSTACSSLTAARTRVTLRPRGCSSPWPSGSEAGVACSHPARAPAERFTLWCGTGTFSALSTTWSSGGTYAMRWAPGRPRPARATICAECPQGQRQRWSCTSTSHQRTDGPVGSGFLSKPGKGRRQRSKLVVSLWPRLPSCSSPRRRRSLN